MTTQGFNLIGIVSPGCDITPLASDITDVDALLGPLADNGGPTLTHALLEGSPAIDKGGDCPPPTTDQRGALRPAGEECDIGAYESGSSPPTPTPTPAPTPTPTPTSTPAPTPTQAASPTPTPTGGPTPSATPTPTPPAGQVLLWGDNDCNDSVAATDALKTLQELAGLPYNVEPGCPDMGSVHDVQPAGGFGELAWGDVDCDGGLAATDALSVLRHIAALPVNQAEVCPEIEAEVSIVPVP